MSSPEGRLPDELCRRASLRGSEYAWRIADIPEVIATARDAGLVNVGGQLQFRLSDGRTCECYWVEVDTFRSVPTGLSWHERVSRTADVALADFARLTSEYDFLKEGRSFKQVEEQGANAAGSMYFVWYLLDEETAAGSERASG